MSACLFIVNIPTESSEVIVTTPVSDTDSSTHALSTVDLCEYNLAIYIRTSIVCASFKRQVSPPKRINMLYYFMSYRKSQQL